MIPRPRMTNSSVAYRAFLPSPYSSHDQSLARRFLTFLLPSSFKAWPVQLKARNVSAQLRIVPSKPWAKIRKGTKPIAPRQLHRKDELKADLLHKPLPQGPEESIRCEAVCQVRWEISLSHERFRNPALLPTNDTPKVLKPTFGVCVDSFSTYSA